MSAADGMITVGRALGSSDHPGPVFSNPFQVFIFLACCECTAATPSSIFSPHPLSGLSSLRNAHPFDACAHSLLSGAAALVMAVVLVQCASGQVIKDIDGDGIDDLTVKGKEQK